MSGAVNADAADVTRSDEVGRPATAGPSSPRRRRRYLREPVPWRRSDLTRALVLAVLGAGIGVWAWIGVSGEVRLREQEIWVVVACFGAAVAACGAVYFLTVASREVRLGQRQLMFDLADVMGWSVTVTKRGRLQLHAAAEVEDVEDVEDVVVSGPDALVVGPGMTMVHRSECPIARNKPVEPISAADAAARSLSSCGVCRS
ncbi:hypothetical protein [Sporichthya polymorpha]|uniref:hypothetical protein n=1 Tax=Sporichthya polymorpha TaxID=35751 RepID=UPI000371E691|nr:hypothetical protein [Sporichthya polymorpha]